MPCFFQKHGETITTPSSVLETEQRIRDSILWGSFTRSILLSGILPYVQRVIDGKNPAVGKF